MPTAETKTVCQWLDVVSLEKDTNDLKIIRFDFSSLQPDLDLAIAVFREGISISMYYTDMQKQVRIHFQHLPG